MGLPSFIVGILFFVVGLVGTLALQRLESVEAFIFDGLIISFIIIGFFMIRSEGVKK